MHNSLRPNLETVLDKSQKRRSLSPSEIASQLCIGKLAVSVLSDGAKTILRRTPGPADVEQLAIMHLITSEYRNGKTDPVSGSRHIFTSPHEMQALRKLVFGIDEEKTVKKRDRRRDKEDELADKPGDRAGHGHGIGGMGKVPGYRARPLEGARRKFRRVTETARSSHQFHQFQKVEKMVKRSEV
jgi:hypothetical protein